jgi:hypothetical protein
MRQLLLALCVALPGMGFTQTPSILPSIVGLWQFAENSVWIKIDEDGTAYQCRIGREGTVFSASGTFVAPSSIKWQNIWETDNITLRSGTMVLTGRFGEFEHHRSSRKMGAGCLPVKQRPGIGV